MQELIHYMPYLQNTNTDAFIVLKDGKIVLENTLWPLLIRLHSLWASAGKSLTSMMMGIAQQKNYYLKILFLKFLGRVGQKIQSKKENLITIKPTNHDEWA